jgi:hypothetical protein
MTASDYIAICSAVIALCALGATFWQTKHSKQHSLLSVRPLLCWHKSKTATGVGCFVTFTVKNLGLGPAVIHKRFFSLNGERLETESDDTGLVELVTKKAIGDKFVVRVLRSGLLGAGTALPSEGDFLIAEILFVGMETSAAEAALRSLTELDFVVEYKSMYEEPFTLSALHGNSPGWEIAR